MNNRVRDRRIELGYSKSELSKLSKVSRSTIIAIESNNVKYLRSDTMMKLAIALKCDITDIFFDNFVMQTQQ